MYLEKNGSFDEPYSLNCSGIDVQLSRDKQKVMIHQVYENSPAAEAGIKINSELVSVNGKSSQEINMQEIIRLLKEDGKSVDLVVKQDGAEKSITLKLKHLI